MGNLDFTVGMADADIADLKTAMDFGYDVLCLAYLLESKIRFVQIVYEPQ